MTADEFNVLAWREFLDWAISHPAVRAQFAGETGICLDQIEREPGGDGAAGHPAVRAFVRWATEKHWGIEHAPAAYRAVIEAAEPQPTKFHTTTSTEGES